MKLERYQRQILLPQIGHEGQVRLAQSKVLCIGAGGLGSPASLYLAAAGVGELTLIDDDRISLSNLQRQILFDTANLGASKAERAQARLMALNPEVKISAVSARLTKSLAERLIPDFDVVVDGSDNFETKFLCNDACVKFGVPLVYGSILRFEGQLSVFDAKKGPCYRCLHPEMPQAAIPNCAEVGVLGALAGVIGSAQAMEAIKILLNRPELPPLIGKLAILDATAFSWASFTIGRNPQCPVCSLSSEQIILKDSPVFCSKNELDEIAALIARPPGATAPIIVDLRETEELASGMIAGAIHWPFSKLEAGEAIPLPPEASQKTVILYCQSGLRSSKALLLLQQERHPVIISIPGGILAWIDAGLPIRYPS
jgi:adenylyltransferase/sulfurtransferase